MHTAEITIENISKIEGSAGLKVYIKEGRLSDLKFIIQDYRRFYTEAVKGQPYISTSSFLSRICGTCSVSHLFASIKAIEEALGIDVTEQTKVLRRLAYDGLMIRDHALHLYFFVLPDVLGVVSILDIPDDANNLGHILLHDSFDIKKLGTEITNVVIGAAIHAPYPTVGGFLKQPDQSKFAELADKLEAIRPQVIRGIKTFYEWDIQLKRNTDYMCLRNPERYDFLEGEIINSDGDKVAKQDFHKFLETVVIPYSQAEGYLYSKNHDDYLVGSLARLNLNKDQLNPKTLRDIDKYVNEFPTNNIHRNNLAQAIEILHCVDEAIDILRYTKINQEEKPIRKIPQAGVGVGVVEAPRGILYHYAKTNEKGMIVDYDVVVPTAQNQINIENDLKKYFSENIDANEDILKHEAEKIIRAYDPCMSCATNFLKLEIVKS
jgi:sulfhydrogenase subunit alpha